VSAPSQDVEVLEDGKGLVLKVPKGRRYRGLDSLDFVVETEEPYRRMEVEVLSFAALTAYWMTRCCTQKLH
jgi:hypothetical protein